MRYHALATDYDGTIASNGRVPEQALEALRLLRASGRKLILVTGRELPDLLGVFPHPELFDRIVAENGALLCDPATKEERTLAEPPPKAFAVLLREANVAPISIGRVIVATIEPYDTVVLQAIRQLGLELQVIFNKGAVMILPSGVNKATGLAAALDQMGLSPRNVVAIGDAENDHALLDLCECSAAVANALPSLKARADIVTAKDHGSGVAELIERLIADDLRGLGPSLIRHSIPLGLGESGHEVRVQPCGSNWLVTGSDGGGKSTLVQGFLERVFERGYQACVFDTEGDYDKLEKAVVYGGGAEEISSEGFAQVLEQPQARVVVNLHGIKPQHRADMLRKLLPVLESLRRRTGRPHWVVLDQAQQLLATEGAAEAVLSADLPSLLFVTAHPGQLPEAIAPAVEFLVATGNTPGESLQEFCSAVHVPLPELPTAALEPGEALLWKRAEPGTARFRPLEPASVRHQHAASQKAS